NKLKEQIKQDLSLPELPDVLPFNARLLYYAQCAWGSGSLHEPSTVDQATRSKFLKALFEDCFNRILQCIGDNVELAQWFFNLRMQIISGNNIDDETMRKILHYSLEWSGGRELWDCFRVRV
ncbi:MAG: hypothetical protein ACKPH7_22205, partial [Planktothrix sp.]